MSAVLHGVMPQGCNEFTLCGLAEDAFQDGQVSEPVVFASIGQVITCEQCRQLIRAMRAYKTDWRQPA